MNLALATTHHIPNPFSFIDGPIVLMAVAALGFGFLMAVLPKSLRFLGFVYLGVVAYTFAVAGAA